MLESKVTSLTNSTPRYPMGEYEQANEYINQPPSPWALQTAETLAASLREPSDRVQSRIFRASLEPYKPTIDALRKKGKSLTATDVSKLTKRTRNTESSRLKRLYIAGIINRKLISGKVFYTLSNPEKVEGL